METRLAFHNRKELPLHRLPFVGKVSGKAGVSFWDVPSTGGYAGGCQTGEALAQIYLKHLKQHGIAKGGTLQSIVLDMLRCQPNYDDEQESLGGQIVGFFSELDHWLGAATAHLNGGLDKLDNRQLLKAANSGLNAQP